MNNKRNLIDIIIISSLNDVIENDHVPTHHNE